jgi:L-threonylcarbamoyladenylate synthase
VESTVLDLSGAFPVLLRPGGLTAEAIERRIGTLARPAPGAVHLRSPGLLASHYAPRLPVRLRAGTVAADEALLAFGPPLAGAGAVFHLSLAKDLTEAAARLFAGLHWLDAVGAERGLTGIAVMEIPQTGLGLAINDRLHRAAAAR